MLNLLHGTDLIVISSHHHDSDAVRTSELMAKMALNKRVYFFAAPKYGMTKKPTFYYLKEYLKVTVVQPFLLEKSDGCMVRLMKEFIRQEQITRLTLWTDTPEALPLVQGLNPEVLVFDQTDFAFESSHELNRSLIERASIVFDEDTSNEELGNKILRLSTKNLTDAPRLRLPPVAKSRYQEFAI